MLSSPVLPYFLLILTLSSSQDLGTDVKTNLCPKYNYASRLEFSKSPSNDYNVAVECQPFMPSTNSILGQEECELRQPFPLDGYALLWNDYLRNCRCNEYVAGVKQFLAGWNGTGAATTGTPVRLMQLQCCWSSNKEQVPPSCVSSGMEYLQSPWGKTSMGVTKDEMKVGSNFAIQSLIIKDGYMNARVCEYRVSNNKGYTIPVSGIKGCWSGVDWDCTENEDQGGVCYDKTTSMYSWDDQLTLNNENSVASLKSPSTDKQTQMCRSGYRLSSLSKKVINNGQQKSYEFSIKCSPLTSRTCYCLWLPKCPTDVFFGTPVSWYVAGVRNLWDTADKNTKLEVLCCHSHSIKLGFCHAENLQADDKPTFDLNDKVYTFPLKAQTEVMVVTNVETYYDKDVLNMRFNVCAATYQYEWCHNDPCYWCHSRAYRDGAVIQGAGYWSAQDAGQVAPLSSQRQVSLLSSNQLPDSFADENYWDSWNGWSSWSGDWGNCGGMSLNTMWLGGLGGIGANSARRGRWASWNTWRRNNAYYYDDHFVGCPSCSRATPLGGIRGKPWTSSRFRPNNPGGNGWKPGGFNGNTWNTGSSNNGGRGQGFGTHHSHSHSDSRDRDGRKNQHGDNNRHENNNNQNKNNNNKDKGQGFGHHSHSNSRDRDGHNNKGWNNNNRNNNQNNSSNKNSNNNQNNNNNGRGQGFGHHSHSDSRDRDGRNNGGWNNNNRNNNLNNTSNKNSNNNQNNNNNGRGQGFGHKSHSDSRDRDGRNNGGWNNNNRNNNLNNTSNKNSNNNQNNNNNGRGQGFGHKSHSDSRDRDGRNNGGWNNNNRNNNLNNTSNKNSNNNQNNNNNGRGQGFGRNNENKDSSKSDNGQTRTPNGGQQKGSSHDKSNGRNSWNGGSSKFGGGSNKSPDNDKGGESNRGNRWNGGSIKESSNKDIGGQKSNSRDNSNRQKGWGRNGNGNNNVNNNNRDKSTGTAKNTGGFWGQGSKNTGNTGANKNTGHSNEHTGRGNNNPNAGEWGHHGKQNIGSNNGVANGGQPHGGIHEHTGAGGGASNHPAGGTIGNTGGGGRQAGNGGGGGSRGGNRPSPGGGNKPAGGSGGGGSKPAGGGGGGKAKGR